MKKQKFVYLFIITFLFFFLLFPVLKTSAQESIEIYLFVQQGCQHCAKAEKQLEEWKNSIYPKIDVKIMDITNKESLQLLILAQQAYRFQSQGVPTIFIGEQAVMGAKMDEIETVIKKCQEQTCPQPSEVIQNYQDRQTQLEKEKMATQEEQLATEEKNNTTDLIVIGIIIISIICLLIYLRITGRNKNV